MAKKLTQLEQAIANVDTKIQALQAARTILVEQQAKAPKRKPAAVPAPRLLVNE